MRLVTQTHVTAEVFGDEACIPILKKAGFEALDWSFFGMELGEGIWCTDAWREHALRLKETAAQCGIGFSQAHAPFPSSRGEEPYDREIRKRILRAMEAAALMGVRNIVVHPMQELEYATNRDRLWEENLEFYRSLIPYCQEYGIRICAENMWQRDKKRGYIVDSVCAPPQYAAESPCQEHHGHLGQQDDYADFFVRLVLVGAGGPHTHRIGQKKGRLYAEQIQHYEIKVFQPSSGLFSIHGRNAPLSGKPLPVTIPHPAPRAAAFFVRFGGLRRRMQNRLSVAEIRSILPF